MTTPSAVFSPRRAPSRPSPNPRYPSSATGQPGGRGLIGGRRLLLACLTLPFVAAPAHAAATGGSAPVLAQWNWWFWLGYFSNVGSRGNVVMLCFVILFLSLLILMSATRRS